MIKGNAKENHASSKSQCIKTYKNSDSETEVQDLVTDLTSLSKNEVRRIILGTPNYSSDGSSTQHKKKKKKKSKRKGRSERKLQAALVDNGSVAENLLDKREANNVAHLHNIASEVTNLPKHDLPVGVNSNIDELPATARNPFAGKPKFVESAKSSLANQKLPYTTRRHSRGSKKYKRMQHQSIKNYDYFANYTPSYGMYTDGYSNDFHYHYHDNSRKENRYQHSSYSAPSSESLHAKYSEPKHSHSSAYKSRHNDEMLKNRTDYRLHKKDKCREALAVKQPSNYRMQNSLTENNTSANAPEKSGKAAPVEVIDLTFSPDLTPTNVQACKPVDEALPEKTKEHRSLFDLPLPPNTNIEELKAFMTKNACRHNPMPHSPDLNSQLYIDEWQPAVRSRPIIYAKQNQKKPEHNWGDRQLDAFEIIEKIGKGSFGLVYKARDRSTEQLVALKTVRLRCENDGFPISAIREMKILRQVKHDNIVNLQDVIAVNIASPHGAIYLVFEYMEHDLFGLIVRRQVNFNELQAGSVMKQLLLGLNYCHQRNFLHRDIKSTNILMNNMGKVKLADFGLARIFNANNPERPYTNKVITLWYRPPELLLGEERYGTAVDVWSCGCILAELFLKRPLFLAKDEMEQIEFIANICGTPEPAVWPSIIKLPHFHKLSKLKPQRRCLHDVFNYLSDAVVDLLDKMLLLDPEKRISTAEAIEEKWLRDIVPALVTPPELPNVECHEYYLRQLDRESDGIASPDWNEL